MRYISSLGYLWLHVFVRRETGENTCECGQNQSFVSNNMSPKHYIKCYKQKNELWKTASLTGFQKSQLQNDSIFFCVHPCWSCYFCFFIYTFFQRFERLFLCFIHFWSGSSHCLNFDKFRDTVLLNAPITLRVFIANNITA